MSGQACNLERGYEKVERSELKIGGSQIPIVASGNKAELRTFKNKKYG